MDGLGLFCVAIYPIFVLSVGGFLLLSSILGIAAGIMRKPQQRLFWILAGCAAAWGISLICIFLESR